MKKKLPYIKTAEICPLVEATCCITSGGKGYDNDFQDWIRYYIKYKIKINK